MAGAGNFRKLGSLQFQQILRDFLLGAGNHIPISQSAAVKESETFEPLLSSVTEGLVDPSVDQELTISLDTAISEVLTDIDDDTKALCSLNFSLPEEEGMKYFTGILI